MATGGSIEALRIDGRRFPIASDADTNRRFGGKSNTVESNGDGSVRLIQTQQAAMLSGFSVVIDDLRGDQEFLQNRRDSKGFYPCSVIYASGVAYSGDMQIVDDLDFSSQSTTATLSLSGPQLRRQ